jgi:hypothetical protein
MPAGTVVATRETTGHMTLLMAGMPVLVYIRNDAVDNSKCMAFNYTMNRE